MVAISWAFGVSGDWSNGLYWTGGETPGLSDDATIAATGTYTVTVSTADAANSLLLNAAGATLAISGGGALTIAAALDVTAGVIQLNSGGRLNIDSTLQLAGGTLQLTSGGVISGGTLSADGGSFVWNGGTLSGATYAGTLALEANAILAIGAGGLIDAPIVGGGAGLVDLTGAESDLKFVATQTFGDATIEVGNATPPPRYGHGTELTVAGGATLTLDSLTQIAQVGKYVDINGGGILINQGTINATYADGSMFVGVYYAFPNKIALEGFNNQGVINIDNGTYFGLESLTAENSGVILVNDNSTLAMHETYEYESGPGKIQTITNSGDILLTNNSKFYFDYIFSTFTNRGTITAESGSKIVLTSNFYNSGQIIADKAQVKINSNLLGAGVNITNSSVDLWFGHLSTGDLERLGGKHDKITLTEATLQNTGSILAVGNGSDLGTLTLAGGIVSGGTVADAGGGIVFEGGGVSDVVYEGALDLSGAASDLSVGTGGITLTGAGGTGPGLIDLTSQTGTISFAAALQTLDNATVDLGGGHAVIDDAASQQHQGQLTLGPDLTIVQTGSYADIGGYAVINQGVIYAGAGGAQFDVTASFFWNEGLVDVGGGGDLELHTLYNQSGTILNGGTFEVEAGSTLMLETSDHSGPVIESATIILSGPGAIFETLDGSGVAHSLDSTLATIGAGGVLELLAGRGWSSTLEMTNTGVLKLAGGSFVAAELVNSGLFSGYGVMATSLTNDNLIEIDAGQTLSFVVGALTNLVVGTLTGGAFVVGDGGLLQLADDTSIVTLDAVLVLNGSGSVQGLDTVTGSEVGLKRSLTTIGASGVLELLEHHFKAANAVTNMNVLQLGGGTFSGGKLTDIAGSLLTGFGGVASVFIDSGAVTSVGGALAFSGKHDVFEGALGGEEIDFTGGSDLLSGGSSLTAGTVALSGGAVVTVDPALTFAGAFSETSAKLTLAGETLTFSGTATLEAAAVVNGTGRLAIAAGGTLVGSAGSGKAVVAVAVADSGLIEAAGGTLDLTQALTGAGAMRIDAGATLEVDGAANRPLTTTFAGSGATLSLGTVARFASVIAGFAGGDVIELIKTAATAATLETGDRLLITNGSQTVATLKLSGDYGGDTFTVKMDQAGDARITVSGGKGADAPPPPPGDAPPPASGGTPLPVPGVGLLNQQMAALGAGAGVSHLFPSQTARTFFIDLARPAAA